MREKGSKMRDRDEKTEKKRASEEEKREIWRRWKDGGIQTKM